MSRHTKTTIRIVIVDDHLALRAGLRLLLEKQESMKVVGMASGGEAVSLIRSEKPDVIVLDGDLGQEDGLGMVHKLLGASKSSRILVLTTKTDPESHRRAIHLGAAGVIQKSAAAEALVKAIEKVHMGEVWIDRTTMGKVLDDFRNGHQQDPEANKISRLTRREREVIRLVGLGLKNKEIADKLFISEITVTHHLSSVFDKLEVSNRLDLLIYALGHNLAKMPSR